VKPCRECRHEIPSRPYLPACGHLFQARGIMDAGATVPSPGYQYWMPLVHISFKISADRTPVVAAHRGHWTIRLRVVCIAPVGCRSVRACPYSLLAALFSPQFAAGISLHRHNSACTWPPDIGQLGLACSKWLGWPLSPPSSERSQVGKPCAGRRSIAGDRPWSSTRLEAVNSVPPSSQWD
jgi:hypothetical protein